MKEYKIINRQFNSRSCFICGLDNPFGLKTRFYETENNEIIAVFSTKNEHQSYPGRLHGGVISAILDETIGRAICIGSEKFVWGVTTDLTISYKKPVPLDCELKVIGRVTKDSRRLYEAEGELILPDGSVAATACGKYMKLGIDYIAGDDSSFLDDEWGIVPPEPMPDNIEI